MACSISGCGRKVMARGLCAGHYQRQLDGRELNAKMRSVRGSKGGIDKGGYQRVNNQLEHRMIAERALGKPLAPEHPVHHVDGTTANRPGNLVICQDKAYHMLLHRRTAALDACGHADWRQCWRCRRYDAPENLSIRPPPYNTAVHPSCDRLYQQQRRAKFNHQGVAQ